MDITRLLGKLGGKSNGWKMAAKVNCAILVTASVTLVGLSIAAASTENLGMIFILSGNCDGNMVSAVNVALHLLINILSTLVSTNVDNQERMDGSSLASSNFFMQVLNAPSREELDHAHSKGSWLGIGVSSVRNGFLVSKFKTWCWVALLISSIPIHILFNSIIFETDYRGSDFHLTIGTEDFLHNGTYFLPGASLFSGQEVSGLCLSDGVEEIINWGYGTSFSDREGMIDTNTTQNLIKAAKEGSNWTKIDSKKCWEIYVNCNDLKIYRDLVIVVDQPAGWTRKDMWQLSTDQSRSWDRFVPSNEPNHLFYHARCTMSGDGRSCTNDCVTAFGNRSYSSSQDYRRVSQNGRYYIRCDEHFPPIEYSPEFPQNGQYSFFNSEFVSFTNETAPSPYAVWNISDIHIEEEFGNQSRRQTGLQPDASHLSMKYCLAETPERICHIALLPTLLLSVMVAIVVKTIVALILTVVLSRLNQPPLVTLGDAVASFIEKPDEVTAGFCTLNQIDMKKTLESKNLLLPGPRRWLARQERRLAVVPRSVWLSSYLLFAASISIAVYYFTEGGGLYKFSFLPSDKNPTLYTYQDMTLTQAILLANSPQLLLSFCYLAFNNLFTRMQTAKEWAMLATGYRPLRVTEPQGEQFATYRLQLPYKYSLPLMAISIALHWLLSNTIYIFVSIGGYYDRILNDPSLPSDTDVAVQYSESALLAIIIASVALICVPILLGLKRLPADSINSGSNSMALSAACHASTLVYEPRNGSEGSEHFTQPPSPPPLVLQSTPLSTVQIGFDEEGHGCGTDNNASIMTIKQTRAVPGGSDSNLLRNSFTSEPEKIERSLRKLAQSKVRWGVVKMSPGWYAEYADDGLVEHLGFGTEEDIVSSPVSGNYYA